MRTGRSHGGRAGAGPRMPLVAGVATGTVLLVAVLLAAMLLGGCGARTGRSGEPAAPTTAPGPGSAATAGPPAGGTPSTGEPPPTTTTTTAAPTVLGPGSNGAAVLALQQRLRALGYWLGTPDGTFGDSTEQAVYALQKAAGIQRDGLVGPVTAAALARGIVPEPRSASGYVIEVDLEVDLVMLVTNGRLEWTLNTSTGGGYLYTGGAIADTPVGTFTVFRQVDGLDVSKLGELWRPKYFYSGFAIHGDAYVPPYPVSHGCVRVSYEAIDWIWGDNLAPLGTRVWVYA